MANAAMRPLGDMKSYAVLLLGFAVQAIAHGGDHHGGAADMDMDMGADDSADKLEYPPSYFDHADHKAFIYAHIVLMTLSWVFALPVGMADPESHSQGRGPPTPSPGVSPYSE